MECLGNSKRANGGFPTTEVLFHIYNTAPLVCVHLNSDQVVDLVSPQSASLFNVRPDALMGLSKSECIERIRSKNACIVHEADRSLLYIVKEKII